MDNDGGVIHNNELVKILNHSDCFYISKEQKEQYDILIRKFPDKQERDFNFENMINISGDLDFSNERLEQLIDKAVSRLNNYKRNKPSVV